MIHVGDFDADGRKDLVCRMNHGNKYCIALTGTVLSPFSVELFDFHKIILFKVDTFRWCKLPPIYRSKHP